MYHKLLFVLIVSLYLLAGCTEPAAHKPQAYTVPDASIPADSLLAKANTLKASGTRTQRAYAGVLMGMYYVKKGAYRQSQNELNAGMKLLQDNPDSSLLAATNHVLGKAAKNLGEYPNALVYFTNALDYYEHVNDLPAQAKVHAEIGQVFQLQNDLPQATKHLNTAVRLLGNQKNSTTYLVSLHTLANVYGMRNQLDSALRLDEEGLAISRRLNLPDQVSTFLDNKANCYNSRGQYDSARLLYNQCLELDMASGNKKQMSDTWLNLGVLEQRQHNSEKALAYINKSLALALEAGYRRGEMYGWDMLAMTYKGEGQYQKALEASERYYVIKDSLINEKKENAIAEWKAIYETERKDKEIGQQHALIQKKNLFISFLCIIVPLCVLVLYFASRRNKIKKEKAYREALFAREQQTATDILWAGEKERRRIAADLHDGVGQVLSAALLNLQALGPATALLTKEDAKLVDKAAQLVRNGCSEIRQISHNMMPVVLLKNGLVFALQEFVNALHQKAFSVHLSVDMADVHLSEGKEVMLYRVIQECVNNVVRHAKATRLDIAITHEGEQLSIMIEDNGMGMQMRTPKANQGIGMENIRSRIAWMKGTVEWSSVGAEGHGTLVVIYIPVS